jgi:hypothetical protein
MLQIGLFDGPQGAEEMILDAASAQFASQSDNLTI